MLPTRVVFRNGLKSYCCDHAGVNFVLCPGLGATPCSSSNPFTPSTPRTSGRRLTILTLITGTTAPGFPRARTFTLTPRGRQVAELVLRIEKLLQ